MSTATLTEMLQNHISMAEAARLMGVHVATAWRYSEKGVRGGIRLQTWFVGGKRVTTQDAVERFLCRLNSDPEAETKALEDAATRRGRDANQALQSLGY